MDHNEVARQIAEQLKDEQIARKVHASPEPFRAMVYETSIIKNASEIDGTDDWHKIIDELEYLLC